MYLYYDEHQILNINSFCFLKFVEHSVFNFEYFRNQRLHNNPYLQQ
jgi:hypothetical protein